MNHSENLKLEAIIKKHILEIIKNNGNIVVPDGAGEMRLCVEGLSDKNLAKLLLEICLGSPAHTCDTKCPVAYICSPMTRNGQVNESNLTRENCAFCMDGQAILDFIRFSLQEDGVIDEILENGKKIEMESL